MEVMGVNEFNFLKGKKIFLTGHTGFKGSWLSLILSSFKSVIKGYSLNPETSPSLFDILKLEDIIESEINDIRDSNNLTKSIENFNPEIVFHLAAQPLVRDSYDDPKKTYETNVIGTLNLLEACRKVNSIKAIIVITTDKVYFNKEIDYSYVETDRLGGYDPYSSSKSCCELLVDSYRKSFFNKDYSPKLATVRAGNVIGGGDWADDRIIPDILNGLNNGHEVIIRNPKSIRPWQHVLEPLFGYLYLAKKLCQDGGTKYCDSWNFGPNEKDCWSVEKIVETIKKITGKNIFKYQDNNISKNEPHESGLLKLNSSKASKFLDWYPRWDTVETLNRIIEWNNFYVTNPDNMLEYCKKEIKEFLK